jgi:hypothetical protein
MRALRVCRFITSSLSLACVVAACGSNDSTNGNGNGGSGASGPNGTAAGGPDLGNVGASSSSGGTTGAGDPEETCAGDLIEAKGIPLDMYVMLDSSGSMLDPTEGDAAITKWQAVGTALSDFVNDPESAGIGIGLQRFPLVNPEAPAQCTSDADCGAEFGPCFLKACWPPSDGGLVPCGNLLDCESFSCVTFGVCENDDTYVCPTVGEPCGVDAGVDLGDCVAAPPSECMMTADCRATSYANPASPIAELPGAKDAVLAAIAAAEPEGATPSGPALAGAIEQASAWAEAHPDRQVVAVLATDGLPTLEASGNSCTPILVQAQVDAVAQLAADGRAATPSISTFVIGVMGPNDVGGPETLSAIAVAGGTGDAFIVDTQGDVAAQFRDALNQIRGTRLACELAVPPAEAGKRVDFNQVNVTFDNGSGPSTLFYVEASSGCDATTGGWYYDKLPSVGDPERIIVCPTTCEQFGQVDMGSVQIKLGCATRVPK